MQMRCSERGNKMVKAWADFELREPLEKTADETLDEIIEELFVAVRKGNVENSQALAKTVKDVAIAKAVLSRIKSD